MKILLNWSNFKIFQIKYNEWVSNFGIFENQKLNKMTSNVNETSIMIHMRLTACRLDTCATSGRCYTSDLLRISICQRCFNYFIYVVCAVWTTCEQGSTHRSIRAPLGASWRNRTNRFWCADPGLWIWRWRCPMMNDFWYWNICKLIDWYF